MNLRQLDAGPMFSSRVRAAILRALESPSLNALSYGAPRLFPAAPEPRCGSPIAEHLLPFQRGLWRRRAAIVMLRAVMLAFAWLLCAEMIHRTVLGAVPIGMLLIPSLVLLGGGS